VALRRRRAAVLNVNMRYVVARMMVPNQATGSTSRTRVKQHQLTGTRRAKTPSPSPDLFTNCFHCGSTIAAAALTQLVLDTLLRLKSEF
jgi:hypothetical protein